MYIIAAGPNLLSKDDENQKNSTSEEHDTANMEPSRVLSPPSAETCSNAKLAIVPAAAPIANVVRKKKNICHEATTSPSDFQNELVGVGATISSRDTTTAAIAIIPMWI
jgi:hypothetical protein